MKKYLQNSNVFTKNAKKTTFSLVFTAATHFKTKTLRIKVFNRDKGSVGTLSNYKG